MLGGLLQAAVDQYGQFLRRRRVEFRDARSGPHGDLLQRDLRVAAFERFAPAGDLEEDGSEGGDIAAMVERFAERLFGRHVGRRAEDAAGHGENAGYGEILLLVFRVRGSRHLGEAEVQHFDEACGGDHDVAGFEIAMDDPAGVSPGDAESRLMGVAEEFGQWIARFPMHPAAERVAFHELHGEEVDAIGLAEVVDGDDVRMVERGSGAGFATETQAVRFVNVREREQF